MSDQANVNPHQVKLGPFLVEPGFDPMCAGHYLNVTMPDGRVVVVFADAVEPEEQGGTSVIEVWKDQARLDAGDYRETRQIGF